MANGTSTRGEGRGARGKKFFYVPKMDLQFRAPLINFNSSLRRNFLMWAGGWVGGPRLPSPPPPGKGKQSNTEALCQPPPTPRVTVSRGLFVTVMYV